MSAAMLEQAQIERTRATKVLKGRDLQRIYSDQISIDVVQPGLRHDEKDGNNKEASLLPSTRYTPSIATHPIMQEVANTNSAPTPFPSQVDPSNQQRAGKVSSRFLVPEPVPRAALCPLGQNSTSVINGPERTENVGILHTAHDVTKENLQLTPGCEDKEKSFQETTDTPPEAAWEEPRAKSHGSNHTSNRMPASDQLSFTNHKDVESKLEARISALERKNTILLRVVMAVLDESGNLSAPSGGDRSSGLSSASSLYGSRESRLEAKFDAVLSFLQENKRLSAEQ
jgi:hypothetical protein